MPLFHKSFEMHGDWLPRHLQLPLVALLLWSISCSFGEPNPLHSSQNACPHTPRCSCRRNQPSLLKRQQSQHDTNFHYRAQLRAQRNRPCRPHSHTRDPLYRAMCPSRATLKQLYRWVRSACASRDMIECQRGVKTCDTPSDGDEVPGLQWFAVAGRCQPGDSFGGVNFTFTPPPNAYLHIPPTNQITFCFSLRVSSQPGMRPALCPSSLTPALPTPAPLSTTCARVIVSRCRCVFASFFRRTAITGRV
jgi:hypothetical protein